METGKDQLDQHIKKMLGDLDAINDAPGWEDFLPHLETAEVLPDESEIADALNDLDISMEAGSWEAFEQAMDQHDAAADEAFDTITRQALGDLKVPYEKSHWEMMAGRLEEEYSIRRRIYHYKVMEIALMLLLFFTLFNLLPPTAIAPFARQQPQTQLSNTLVAEFKKEEKFKAINSISSTDVAQHKSNDTFNNSVAANDDVNSIAAASIILNEDEGSSAINKNIKSINEQEIIGSVSAKSPSTTSYAKDLKPLVTRPVRIVATDNLNNFQNNIPPTEKMNEELSNPVALTMPETSLLDLNQYMPDIILKPAPTDGFWRFSMVGNFEANFVFSPDNEELGSSRDTTIGYGYGGGILAGYQKGRWGFETGALYNHKSYPPNFLNQFNPQNNPNLLQSEFFQDIQLELLQIPLNVQYAFIEQPKWRAYVSTGATINMLLQPLYQIRQERAALVVGPPPSTPPDQQPDNSIRNKTEFPMGIINGGGFNDNSYLTANLGLGVERSLGPYWSVFAQPTYQHQISKEGLRPFRDKFYTVSVLIGARVSLK